VVSDFRIQDDDEIDLVQLIETLWIGKWKIVWIAVMAVLLVGMWGGTDIIVDPYTNAKKAVIAITASQMVDVNVRHPQSFNVVTLTS
jgi:LPS O-antigen subunit length determinant protein (WzzB/FepE family)